MKKMFNSYENEFKLLTCSAYMFNAVNTRYKIKVSMNYNFYGVVLYDSEFKAYQRYDLLMKYTDFCGVHEVLAFYDRLVEIYELCLKEGIK